MITPRMSHHARLRCEQMGLSTKVAKSIVRDHDVAWMNAEGETVATSDRYPDVTVAYVAAVDGGYPVVMTVLPRTQDTYRRPDTI